MNITEVRITLRNEEKLKAFASITFDDCFVVRGLKVINGSQG
ncbi:MAG: SpoVG family protein, partial [Ignavibacteria bacterium]|nr:SpoVG family protein [Ignavibacteria bacterium]